MVKSIRIFHLFLYDYTVGGLTRLHGVPSILYGTVRIRVQLYIQCFDNFVSTQRHLHGSLIIHLYLRTFKKMKWEQRLPRKLCFSGNKADT